MIAERSEVGATNTVIKRRLIAITILCLLIVASRVFRLSSLELDRDEIWSVWQTFGTPAQIINWTPYDWPPSFYLLLGGWRALTGISPFAVSLLPLFIFLPGIAILYRFGCKRFDDTTALIAATACAAMGYVVHISLNIRGYSLIFTLVMLAWWLALRYFEKPTIRSGVYLGLAVLALFYTHFTTLFPVVMIGLFMAVLYPRRVWRWWLPLVIAGLGVLPELLVKLSSATERASTGMSVLQDWLASNALVYRQNLAIVMQDLTGYNMNVWAIFVFIAGVLIVSRFGLRRNVLALLIWMLTPLVFFFAILFTAFNARTFIWMAAGYALWIGWGLSQLPRPAIAAFLLVFVVAMSGPVPITESYKHIDTPLVGGFSFLTQHLQAGDVVLIDPNVSVVAEEWDYFTRVYFPQGLQWAQTPGSYRRIWYFSQDGKQNGDIYTAVQRNRVAESAYHFAPYSLQLYEQPPDLQGVLFENGMRFNGVDVLNQPGPTPIFKDGETIHLRLWWSIDQPVKLDYSVGAYVLDQTGLLAQADKSPQPETEPPVTSRWIFGEYYALDRDLILPAKMTTASYTIKMSVYEWQDNKRVKAPGTDADNLLTIASFQIKSWN